MSKTYEETVRELQGTMQKDFGLSNPDFWELALKKEDGVHVEKIARMVKVVQDVNKQLDASKPKMVEIEVNKVIQKRAQTDIGPIAEFVSSTAAHPRPVLEEANRNVAVEIARRKFEHTEKLRDQVHQVLKVGNHHAQLKIDPKFFDQNREHMMRSIKSAIEDHGAAGNQIHQTYYSVKGNIEQMAIKLGSDTPAQTVKHAFKQAHKYNDEHRNARIGAAFTEANHEYQKGDELQEAQWLIQEEKNEQRQKAENLEVGDQFQKAGEKQQAPDKMHSETDQQQKEQPSANKEQEQKQDQKKLEQNQDQLQRQADAVEKQDQTQKQKQRQRQ